MNKSLDVTFLATLVTHISDTLYKMKVVDFILFLINCTIALFAVILGIMGFFDKEVSFETSSNCTLFGIIWFSIGYSLHRYVRKKIGMTEESIPYLSGKLSALIK